MRRRRGTKRWMRFDPRIRMVAIITAAPLLIAAGSSSAMHTIAASQSTQPNASQTSTDDWPMFHHDPIHSGLSSDTAVGASAASSGLVLAFEVPAGSMIESSLAVAYNTTLGKTLVYVQTWSNLLLALDASTGATVWTYADPGPLGADSSPAVYDGTVYVGGLGNHTLFAVDATTG